MNPKRLFQVYEEEHKVYRSTKPNEKGEIWFYSNPFEGGEKCPDWRFRVIATRNGKIVGGSGEAFDSKANALRAARREASLYPEGVAAVEVKE